MIILIPAYEPDRQLPALIRAIRDAEPWATVVVVDDGSGPEYKDVFDGVMNLECRVIGYARNRGKGFALKAGFAFIAEHLPGRDVICADSDGQHTIVDILRVAAAVQSTESAAAPAMVLGTRNFSGNVPARSKLGNAATRLLFTAATGERIADTQTGLRGYPGSMLPWLGSVRGERSEYELCRFQKLTAQLPPEFRGLCRRVVISDCPLLLCASARLQHASDARCSKLIRGW